MQIRPSFIYGFILICLCSPAFAQGEKVDAYVRAEMEKRHIPGVSVAVVRDGQVTLAKGYGLSDVELSAPAGADTVYELASVTKQFTATAVMMLVEEGKIGLDDSITKLVPDLPSAWSGVTVRHLLTHTSGIKSYTDLYPTPMGFEKAARLDVTPKELIAKVAELPPDFAPGEKWHYNNTGYFLLGMLIEKVSGKPYGEFLAERIFLPLGMTATRLNDMAAIVPNRASGYAYRGGQLRNAAYVSPTQPFAAGALVSTVSDMAKWDAALYTDKLVKKATLDQMWTPAKLKDRKETDYGFGWQISKRNGHRLIAHGGGIPGFSTQIARFVDDRLTVIVLTNLDGGDAGRLALGIAGLYLPALAEAPKGITDDDSKTTAALREVLVSLAEGKADPERFIPEARKEVFPDRAKQAKELLSGFGPLKSFVLVERRMDGDLKVHRYRATFGDTDVIVMFAVTKEGKIAGAGISPG